jgi:hypothetical protein
VFCEGVQLRPRFCPVYLSCVKMVVFQFCRQSGKQTKVGWVGTPVMLFLVKNSFVKTEMWDGALSWWNSQLFVTKVLGEVFVHFHAVAAKRQSSIRNWMFGLPGRIACIQSSWCQIKWWTCSWLYSSPVSSFSASVILNFPCTIHALFT